MNALDTSELTVSRLLVVAAAGRHGSTEEIADRVTDRLRACLPKHWHIIQCSPADPLIEVADAVVLGSAIYLGRWMPAARACLQVLQHFGPEHIWLFSSGPVSDQQSGQRDHVLNPADVPWRTHEHRLFGGRLDPAGLSGIERFLTRMVGARQDDRRDWIEIDGWTNTIAAHLALAYAEQDFYTEQLIAAGGPRSPIHPGRRSPHSVPFARGPQPRPSATVEAEGDPS